MGVISSSGGLWEQVQKIVAGWVHAIVPRTHDKRDVGIGGYNAGEGVARAN